MKVFQRIVFLVFMMVSHKSYLQSTPAVQEKISQTLSLLSKESAIFNCLDMMKNHCFSELLINIPLGVPLHNSEQEFNITSLYGRRFHPIHKTWKNHMGIDIAASVGTYIIATGSGVVEKITNSESGHGKQVIIKHASGFKSSYSHLYLMIVKKGDIIVKGDIIGLMGSTGASTGNHLHYEIHKNKKKINPKRFLLYSF